LLIGTLKEEEQLVRKIHP